MVVELSCICQSLLIKMTDIKCCPETSTIAKKMFYLEIYVIVRLQNAKIYKYMTVKIKYSGFRREKKPQNSVIYIYFPFTFHSPYRRKMWYENRTIPSECTSLSGCMWEIASYGLPV